MLVHVLDFSRAAQSCERLQHISSFRDAMAYPDAFWLSRMLGLEPSFTIADLPEGRNVRNCYLAVSTVQPRMIPLPRRMVRLAPNIALLHRRSAEQQIDRCRNLQRYGYECDDQYLPLQCHHFSIPHDSVLQGKGHLQLI